MLFRSAPPPGWRRCCYRTTTCPGTCRRQVTELCLEANRVGLLNLSWNVLCPRCGGAKSQSASLDQLPQTAHCPSCNIAYDSSFTKNVEISFRPAPSIRRSEEHTSELQSLMRISYAVFCLKKKKYQNNKKTQGCKTYESTHALHATK